MFKRFLDANEARKVKAEEVSNDVPALEGDQIHNPFNEIQILSGHKDIVHLMMLIDDSRLVSAAHDNTVIIWNYQTGQKIGVLDCHVHPVTCMLPLVHQSEYFNFGEDLSIFLLTGSSDRTICVWDIDDCQLVKTINEHNSSVKCLASINSEKIFCSGGQDLCLWDEQGSLLHKLERKSEDSDIHCLLPIKNNCLVAASDRCSLVVYAVITNDTTGKRNIKLIKHLPPHREAIRCLASVTDGMFASASLDGAIILWTTHSLSPSMMFNQMDKYEGQLHMYPYSVQKMFAVDQRFVFAAVGHGYSVYDGTSKRCVAQIEHAHFSKVVDFSFLREGRILLTCSEDGTVRLWGCPHTPITPGTPSAVSFSDPFSQPSMYVIEKFLGKSLEQLQNLSSPVKPKLLGECSMHSGTVHMVLPCGNDCFATCASDGLVILWKDGFLQSERRNKELRNILLYSYY